MRKFPKRELFPATPIVTMENSSSAKEQTNEEQISEIANSAHTFCETQTKKSTFTADETAEALQKTGHYILALSHIIEKLNDQLLDSVKNGDTSLNDQLQIYNTKKDIIFSNLASITNILFSLKSAITHIQNITEYKNVEKQINFISKQLNIIKDITTTVDFFDIYIKKIITNIDDPTELEGIKSNIETVIKRKEDIFKSENTTKTYKENFILHKDALPQYLVELLENHLSKNSESLSV